MGDLNAVAGARFYIGPATATKSTDFVAADFNSLAWVEVDGWETEGQLGDTDQLITTSLINRSRDLKQKGTSNAGSMQNNFAFVQGDAGQAAMKAARKTKNNYAFKVVYDDVPAGGSTPTTEYFVGLVMTWQQTGGGANTVRMYQGTVEVNSNVVTVDAV